LTLPKLNVKRANGEALYSQLVKQLEAAIETGELKDGERLPSERDLAERLGLSRTTVVNTYRELESCGLVRSHVGRGTFVCASLEPNEAPFAWRGKLSAGIAHLSHDPAMRQLMRDVANPDMISFTAGAPAIECFPLDQYRQLMDGVLRRSADLALGNAPTEGQPGLRKAISNYFGAKPEQVLILSGAQQGLDLIARCLLDQGDAVVIDRPGYVGAIQTFRLAGANLIGWDVVRADLGELEDLILRYRPKLIYTNPTFQNPTGRILPLWERKEMLRLAARYRVPIVEDDPYSETYLDTPPPTSLYHLDSHRIVIYLSTLSKTFAPGIRLGWLVASAYVVEQLTSIKQRENLFTEGLGQLVVAEFLQRGLFKDHLLSLRKEHSRKLNILSQAIDRYLPPKTLEFAQPQGGLYLWCRLGREVEGERLLQDSLRSGVAFANGEMFYSDGAGRQELRLCFSQVPGGKIEEGIRRLSQALEASRTSQAAHDTATVPLV